LQISQYPCTRLFHVNGSIGCHEISDTGAIIPLLYLIEEDLPGLEKLSTVTGQVAVVVESAFLTSSTLKSLKTSGKIGGMYVLASFPFDPTSNSSQKTSPDSVTPQGINTPSSSLTIDNSHPWNSFGNGIMLQDISFPIMYVTDKISCDILKKIPSEYLSDRKPNWVTELDFYFGGNRKITSEECLNWHNKDGILSPKCLPIGGQSVWGTFSSPDSKPVVMAMASIDSTALFHEV
jgi:nicastrin